ncbi:MAG: response regulator [Oscillospiraceae bacterium]|nr:response regulator [Oscillospiraceae bacterium]
MIITFGTVLVVNDVEINLIVARELLESYKMKVDTLDNGFDAVERVKQGGIFDIIFMDNQMPDKDGVETVREIRALGYDGKIVMLTGNVIPAAERDFTLFDDYLLNPIDNNKLEEILNKFIPSMQMGVMPQSKSDRSRLMRAFKKDVHKALESLNELLDLPELNDPLNHSGAIKSLTSVFHAMKTALANTGYGKESMFAYDLEKAGSLGDVAYIKERVSTFIQTLQGFLESSFDEKESDESGDGGGGTSPDKRRVFGDLGQSAQSEQPENAESVYSQLLKIKSACEEYDIREVDLSLQALLEEPLKESTRDFVEQMRDSIYSDSDFDGVCEKISEYISKKEENFS